MLILLIGKIGSFEGFSPKLHSKSFIFVFRTIVFPFIRVLFELILESDVLKAIKVEQVQKEAAIVKAESELFSIIQRRKGSLSFIIIFAIL